MSSQSYTINVQEDFLERQSKAQPLQALSELIWNSLDADAHKIEIYFDRNDLNPKIIVRDDGHGIPYNEAPDLFSSLGGSWKKFSTETKSEHRELHGKEGKGRFKAFSLGRVVEWFVSYENNHEIYEYTISSYKDSLTTVRISDQKSSKKQESGVEVIVSELDRDYRFLETDSTYDQLTEIFAIYLTNYRDIKIYLLGKLVDPSSKIADHFTIPLDDIVYDEKSYTVSLEVIVWDDLSQRTLFLCNNKGFPLHRLDKRFHVDHYQFSAYIKSEFINYLHDNNILDVSEMNPMLNNVIDQAYEKLKSHFKEKAANEARTVVDEWKNDKVYPYTGDATNDIEIIERKVFDIVAVKINNYLPDFSNSSKTNKAFQLRMLRQAIEKSPEELQLILKEVLDLPPRKQQELAQLLRETSLSAIISAAKLVADRLKFLLGLESILFDRELKKYLKERSQLHKIIAENTWIFGEQYNLSVSDQSLTRVLKKHKEILGEETVIDEPVKHPSKERGIIDLMLSRTIKYYNADELQHLIVELKRPKTIIGKEEITQIEEYALAVQSDERFRDIKTKWNFWILSDDYDSYGKYRMDENGNISKKEDVTIYLKVWSQIIEENRTRLQFFKEKLEHEVDEGGALKYLKEKYENLLDDITIEEENEIKEQSN